eukprot:CAMPEP_0181195330 /NCGR_PEP_ID=MMETSP1096-20121128/14827_1 /TAXON_ID=156174 ORGANISM="Chrysochromulina ericina, Strain CCMP281" /NCGR_SAMPLE_ID=MMETSP1096 /ASSEMBLY_ACC=CAM_ASM_000453 /LENGTH=32 /DNA_ID= /DNA_START= /DNA_END= /DNA_ORIENTATION=
MEEHTNVREAYGFTRRMLATVQGGDASAEHAL